MLFFFICSFEHPKEQIEDGLGSPPNASLKLYHQKIPSIQKMLKKEHLGLYSNLHGAEFRISGSILIFLFHINLFVALLIEGRVGRIIGERITFAST